MLNGNARRTPSLRGTITRAPRRIYWPGDEADLDNLVFDVYTQRMSGAFLDSVEAQCARRAGVQTIPAPPSPSWLDASSVQRGAALFASSTTGCTTHGVHSGAGKLTRNRRTTVDVGTGGAFQVPPLVGVGWQHLRFCTTAARRPCSIASASAARPRTARPQASRPETSSTSRRAASSRFRSGSGYSRGARADRAVVTVDAGHPSARGALIPDVVRRRLHARAFGLVLTERVRVTSRHAAAAAAAVGPAYSSRTARAASRHRLASRGSHSDRSSPRSSCRRDARIRAATRR